MNNLVNTKIENLIESFGRREAPSNAMMENARSHVVAHWKQVSKKQKQRQFRLSLMRYAAAITFIVSVSFLIKGNLSIPVKTIGNVAFNHGSIQVSQDKVNWKNVSGDTKISTGDWIQVADKSYMSFNLNDQSQIRINQNTLLHIDTQDQINLINGEIYHDADVAHSSQLIINTSLGNVQHIGTRYAVTVNNAMLTIKVRNGEVKLNASSESKHIVKGQLLKVYENGTSKQLTITPYSDQWKWVQDAIDSNINNYQSLNDFVSWFAHENGYQVDWNGYQLQTKKVKLMGNFATLKQDQLIKTVFLATKYNYKIEKGTLSIIR